MSLYFKLLNRTKGVLCKRELLSLERSINLRGVKYNSFAKILLKLIEEI